MPNSGKHTPGPARDPRRRIDGLLRSLAAIVLAGSALALGTACDRHIEPFDPAVQPARPDLSRIFPAPPDDERPGQAAEPMPQLAGESRGVPGGPGIRGRVEIDPALASAAVPGSTLFIIARRAGSTGGPPLAVLRVANPHFPFDFEIGPANVMVPSMRFEGDISLAARLDSDGSATTRTPGDLQGQLAGNVRPGTDGVEIRLDERL